MIILFVNRFKPFVLLFIFIFILNSNSLHSIIIYVGCFILLFTVYNILISIFDWRTFTFFFTINNIVISDGNFVAKKRYITLNKIQSIQEDKTLLHRMFGLTSLTIVTGTTGDNASVKLDALIPEDAEELNELLKREVETNIVNDNEHTLKEDQKTT